ncbi:sulfatase-like hydrolase/transferase [Gramella sp. AN32]|uniref:Sulfatase n=1 Tax=Christiangramia antarctica TaxID=2058158 RepID=A0ABW5X1L2_9FLAO|nr:sulfatase-like hydrolase/transferase [Gramella sp. AN32]
MKKFLSLLFVSCIFFTASAQDKKPNVILIISDQHAGKIMTQRGYEHIQTPGIDKLAEEGVTFTRAYVAYPVCTASRAAMITGVMPSKSQPKLTEYTSIGQHMKTNGYETAYYGKWHVGNSKMGKTKGWHGFEKYEDLRNDTKIRNLSNDFITRKHDKPFFMITSYLNPHDCCELARNMSGVKDDYHDGPVEENAELSKTPPLPDNFNIPPNEPEGFYVRRTPDSTDMKMFRKHPVKYWDETKWRQYMYGYDRLVEKVDAHILTMIEKLEETNQLENTIIIYTSDHGDGHASHEWNQKMTFYEESVNVPFIISYKGKLSGGLIDKKTLVNTGLDIFTTISAMTGIEYDNSLLGVDLQPSVMKASKIDAAKRNYVVSEMNQLPVDGKSFTGRMVLTDRYKYVIFDGGKNPEQLYDLEVDPGELNPVTENPEYSNQLKAHREMLKDWMQISQDNFDISKMAK